MKSWLILVVAVLLWPGGSSQNAPCSITRQQLATKNLFVFGSQREAQLIQSNHSLQFHCNEGYVIVVPSVRKCVDGYMELPLCISERGQNCSGPPRIENGDIATLSKKQYRSGSSVEFRCQKYYAMEGQKRSFCDDGTWTKVPICLDPCVIPRTELESQKIEVKDGIDVPENIFVQRGLSIELTCRTGYVLEANSSQSGFVIQCDGTPPVIPKCKEITCNSPRISNGSFRPQRTLYHDGDLIRILCDNGFTFEPDSGEKVVECTRNGWSPSPKCVTENACGPPARREREQTMEELNAERYVHGHIISYECRPGYVKNWSIRLECYDGVWQRVGPTKNCTGISCGHPGDSDYASFELTHGDDFTFGARVVYTCNEGYKMLSQHNYRDCRANGWNNEVPRCENIGGKCGRPPPVENGDIVDSSKATYFPSESVIYQCQNFYTMQGSPNVTCQNGRWSQTPTCRAACTASQEDMRLHNIRLKWNDEDKIYAEDGNVVEFVCSSGYKLHPNTRSLRVNCVDGKFNYPNCIPI